MGRRIAAAIAICAAFAVVVASWPRFIAGAAIAPYEDTLRGIARGAKPLPAAIAAAREAAEVSLSWLPHDRTYLRLGAFELVQAGLAADAARRNAALDRSIGALRAGLARAPADAYGWLQLAQAVRMRSGPTSAVAAPLRMSLETAPYEHRLVVPRLEIAFSAWRALDEDLWRAFAPQMMRAVDTAPVEFAKATRRFFLLREVRTALAASPIHLERFNIVYLTPD
jgi:hypothetical protein